MKKRDILKLVKQADRRFFIEAAICPEQHEEECRMKKRTKIWVIAALAAVLSIGGVTAAVAMRGRLLEPTNPEIQEIKPNALGLHLTEETEANTFSIQHNTTFYLTESDSGLYFRKTNSEGRSLLCFADKQTGETVPLCTNPECKHDGSLYCTASTTAYQNPNPIWVNGSLWAVTLKANNPTPDSHGMVDYEHAHAVVLQIAPDGSSIKEAADLGEATQIAQPILHRGCLFFYVQRQIGDSVTVENDITHSTQMLSTTGNELIAFDMTSQQAVTLLSEMPEAGSNYHYALPEKIYGVGDYIYENLASNSWMNPRKSGVYRISLETGGIETIMETDAMYDRYVEDINRNGILYGAREDNKSHAYIMHLLNPDTGEDRAVKSLNSDTVGIRTFDGTYFYGSHYNKDTEDGVLELMIFDSDGNLIGSNMAPDPVRSVGYAVYRDKIYLTLGDYNIQRNQAGNIEAVNFTGKGIELYSCPVQDILDGKTEWKEVAVLKEPKNEDSSG